MTTRVAGGLLLTVTLLASCRPVPIAPRPTLAVFKIRTEQIGLQSGLKATLHEHATQVMGHGAAFRVVDRAELLRTLKRRRRRAERECHTLACQVKIGRGRLGATRSIALHITRNLMGQCDVIGNLYDLEREVVWTSARARAGCAEGDLARSVDLVLCRLVQEQRASPTQRTQAPGHVAPPRDCLTRAEFLWVDDRLELLLQPQRRRRRMRRKEHWEERMAERVLELKREYDRIARHKIPRWRAAALCRSGRLYEHFAHEQVERAGRARAPAPIRRQGPSAVEAHRQEQVKAARQRAAPFVDQAKQLYRQCLELAQERSLPEDRYTAQGRARLKQLEAAGK